MRLVIREKLNQDGSVRYVVEDKHIQNPDFQRLATFIELKAALQWARFKASRASNIGEVQIEVAPRGATPISGEYGDVESEKMPDPLATAIYSIEINGMIGTMTVGCESLDHYEARLRYDIKIEDLQAADTVIVHQHSVCEMLMRRLGQIALAQAPATTTRIFGAPVSLWSWGLDGYPDIEGNSTGWPVCATYATVDNLPDYPGRGSSNGDPDDAREHALMNIANDIARYPDWFGIADDDPVLAGATNKPEQAALSKIEYSAQLQRSAEFGDWYEASPDNAAEHQRGRW